MPDDDVSRSSRQRKIAGTALVAVLAAALIAIVVVRGNGEKVLNGNSDTLVLVGKDANGGLDALGSGTLADVGGCLGWAPPPGQETGTVVIWPHGTTIKTPEPLRVTVDGQTYGVGDIIKISGAKAGALKPSDPFYDKVPQSCQTANVFVASNG